MLKCFCNFVRTSHVGAQIDVCIYINLRHTQKQISHPHAHMEVDFELNCFVRNHVYKRAHALSLITHHVHTYTHTYCKYICASLCALVFRSFWFQMPTISHFQSKANFEFICHFPVYAFSSHKCYMTDIFKQLK